MVQVIFENETEYILDEGLMDMMKSVMIKSLELEDFVLDSEISLTFTTNEDIRLLNSKHRDIDKSTDVLSFPMYEAEELSFMNENKALSLVILGDIVISVDKAKSQSKEYGHSFEREIAFLICHSMFHLLGYDHMTKEDEILMLAKQNEVLSALDINR